MDWNELIRVGNPAAMQWYSMISGRPLPGEAEAQHVVTVPAQVSTLSVVMMLGIVVVGAVLIFRK